MQIDPKGRKLNNPDAEHDDVDDAVEIEKPAVEPIKSNKGGLGKDSIILLMFIGALLATLSALFGGPVRNAMESRQEAESHEYVDMSQVGASCPPLAEKARLAMADGRITSLEVRRIAEALYAAQDERADAEDRSSGYVAIGAKPVRLPPECYAGNLFPTYRTRYPMH